MLIRLLFILLFAIPCFADNGIDYLLGSKYPEIVVEHHPKGWACGFIYEVDGAPKANKVINQLLATGKCPNIRIHLSWRDDHNFGVKDIPIAVRKALEVAKIIERFPNVNFYISPWLEHRASLALIQQLQKEITKVLPKCAKYVNSFISGGAYLPSAINEIHHSFSIPKGQYIHSWDGLEIMDSDVQKFKNTHTKAEINFFWGFRNNCRLELDDPTKRADRKPIACPDSKYIQSMIAYKETKEIKKPIPSTWIYKSHGEAELLGNQLLSRSEKPVWIIPVKGKSIILKAKGKTIVEFEYEKPYHDKTGYYVYRQKNSPLWGYEIAQKVQKVKDGSNANVWIGNIEYGVINPIFRQGSYKN